VSGPGSGEAWLEEQLRRYTAGMTTSLTAAPDAAPEPLPEAGSLPVTPPVALTDADADRIAAAISAARTPSTRRVYAYTWGHWARWCAARDLTPLPGDPTALCAYLTERAAAGIAVSSLDGACTAIRHVHRMHAAADPVASETVRQVRLGLRRTYGTAPRRLARPLTTADIRQILTGIDRATPIGTRDAAIILLGYASAMRRSELVTLTLLDVEEKADGLLITLRRSKTDQEGHGETVAVARGHHPQTDPVTALTAWRARAGARPGRCSPASGAARSASNRSPGTRSLGCFAAGHTPPAWMPNGSPRTRCVPGTPPPRPSAGSHLPESPRRPGTATSPSSSTGTSAPSKHSLPPPAAIWAFEESAVR
jgi:hypothetical protein